MTKVVILTTCGKLCLPGLRRSDQSLFMQRSREIDDLAEFWRDQEQLRVMAVVALATGASLDQMIRASSMARIFSASSSGNLSQRPRMRKSNETPNLSTSCADTCGVIIRFPPSKRDQ